MTTEEIQACFWRGISKRKHLLLSFFASYIIIYCPLSRLIQLVLCCMGGAGYVCVRGFDRETRAPKPLVHRLHFQAAKSVVRSASVRNIKT